MSTEINEQQAKALAYILHEVRREWPTQSILTVLGKNRTVPSYGDLVIAAVAKARDTRCQTPQLIFTAGTHWPDPGKVDLPKPPRCEEHTGQDAHTCTCCWADIKLGQRPENMLGKRMSWAAGADWQEAATDETPGGLEAVKAELKRLQATPTEGGSTHESEEQ